MKWLSLVEEVVVRLQRGEDPEAFAKDLAAFLKKSSLWRKAPPAPAKDDPYAARFSAALAACGFTWWNQERLTPENFPGESFDGGDYDLEYRRLPSNSHGYLAAEIGEVVLAWKKEDATILGSASAGDGLFFSKEVKAGQRDQPNGWIVCPGSTSVDGEMLCLHRDGVSRRANVLSRAHRWFDVDFFLLRKVPAKGGQA